MNGENSSTHIPFPSFPLNSSNEWKNINGVWLGPVLPSCRPRHGKPANGIGRWWGSYRTVVPAPLGSHRNHQTLR